MYPQIEKIFGTLDTPISIGDPYRPGCPLIDVNSAFCSLTGYNKDEIIGKNCNFLQGDGTSEITRREIRRSIDSQSSISICILNYKKDGTPFDNLLFIMPVLDADQKTLFIGCQREISVNEWRKDVEQSISLMDNFLDLNESHQAYEIHKRFMLYSRSIIAHARSYFLMQRSQEAIIISDNAMKMNRQSM